MPGRTEWPSDLDDPFGKAHLFLQRKPYRKLNVMVDDQVQADSDAPLGALLSDLLRNELVSALRYADGGPPADVEPIEGTQAFEGWAVVTDYDPAHGWGVVYPSGEESFAQSGVWGNAVEVAEADDRSTAYSHLSPSEAARRRRLDGLAAQVAAQAVKADLYITERPYLHSVTWNLTGDVAVCTPREAVAAIGLYLRSQGDFRITDRFTFNRGLFYWVGTRELLPEAWRWFGACVKHALATDDDSFLLLAGSLLQRFDRALEIRDEVHLALNQPQDNDTRDAALASLDIVLLFLMGSVDVAAAVAHRVLGLDVNPRSAKWQNSGWMAKVREKAPLLADATEPHEPVLTILRTLRNAVHGEALQGIAFQESSRATESLVGVPADDEPAIAAAMESIGGLKEWGVRELKPGRIHLDAAIFVDRLFDGVIRMLNDLMRETPVEDLEGANLSPDDLGPPTTEPSEVADPFASWIRERIRLQLGFW